MYMLEIERERERQVEDLLINFPDNLLRLGNIKVKSIGILCCVCFVRELHITCGNSEPGCNNVKIM